MTTITRCCGTSVGVLVHDDTDRLLMITRGWYPTGVAPVAGHIADEHTNAVAALTAEVREETGLTVTSHRVLWEGWLPNLCQSLPALPIPGHRWVVAAATAVGELTPDPEETRGASWYTPAEVQTLARRTLAYGRGEVSQGAYQTSPGLEAVWLRHLATAGLLRLSSDDLAVAERLYTTPPAEYWTGDRLVPARQLVYGGFVCSTCYGLGVTSEGATCPACKGSGQDTDHD